MTLSVEHIYALLSRVGGVEIDGRTVDFATLVPAHNVIVRGARVFVVVGLPEGASAEHFESFRAGVQAALDAIPGVEGGLVSLSQERASAAPSHTTPERARGAERPGFRERIAGKLGMGGRSGGRASGGHQAIRHGGDVDAQSATQGIGLGGVQYVIAVASGKGGVGKSTFSANFAVALASSGLKVGVMDADIYGPSQPHLFGLHQRPDTLDDERTMIPLEAHWDEVCLKVMSIGFLLDADAALVWRGPMVISAVTQLLNEVLWGDLDVLVVDMPPGTGDAHLTLAQKAGLSGAVVITTPQDLALIDATRGITMFEKVDVPVLGLVENMSGFVCPSCGAVSDVFGVGGARDAAHARGIPFLGAIGLDIALRESADAGVPLMVSQPQHPLCAQYREIATRVAKGLFHDAVDNTS